MSTKKYTLTIAALATVGALLAGGVGFALGGAGNSVPAACKAAFDEAETIISISADVAGYSIDMANAILDVNPAGLDRVAEQVSEATDLVEAHGAEYYDARAECLGEATK